MKDGERKNSNYSRSRLVVWYRHPNLLYFLSDCQIVRLQVWDVFCQLEPFEIADLSRILRLWQSASEKFFAMTSRNATPCYPSSIAVRVLSERDNPQSHLKDHLVHLWHFKVLRCPTPGPACTTSSPSACSQWSTTSQSSLSWPPGFYIMKKKKNRILPAYSQYTIPKVFWASHQPPAS